MFIGQVVTRVRHRGLSCLAISILVIATAHADTGDKSITLSHAEQPRAVTASYSIEIGDSHYLIAFTESPLAIEQGTVLETLNIDRVTAKLSSAGQTSQELLAGLYNTSVLDIYCVPDPMSGCPLSLKLSASSVNPDAYGDDDIQCVLRIHSEDEADYNCRAIVP